MEIAEFKERSQEFLTYIDVQKGLAVHTLDSYELDLKQLVTFWESHNSPAQDLHEILQSFFIHMYNNKTRASSIAKKFHVSNHLKNFA